MGPLALIAPLLQRLAIADLIDRPLPPDPPLAFSHGRVLSLLLAARLCQPTALSNIPAWAEDTGADLLWDTPARCLNEDRLGRALDAFFTQRHSLLTSVAAQAIQLAELPLQNLPVDTTPLIFYGADEASPPRPPATVWPPTPDTEVPPAHLTHGQGDDATRIQVGVPSVVDALGAVPLLSQCLDGNRQGHTAIREPCAGLLEENRLRPGTLMGSDRGTCSVEPVARLHRHGCPVLCSVPWQDYRALDDTHAADRSGRRASYLSLEQQRRRQTDSSWPQAYDELAVLRHTLTDPDPGQPIPCRVLFVSSRADRFGNRAAAPCFRWEMVPLTAQEQAALPPPGRGGRRPTHRFRSECDEAAAVAAAHYDGRSALRTTAPRQHSADRLFTQFKQQNYVELGHQQGKTPLAVRPVFLKSVRRVEALVCLMQVALTASQLLERFARPSAAAAADPAELHRTTESLLRTFRS